MTNPTSEIAERLQSIRGRIASACARVGRSADSVTLLGASKRQPIEHLQAAWDAGLTVFGENRVQEARAKVDLLPAEAEWHLIGPLQSNKARLAASLFSVIHSVDRPKIAKALDREARRLGTRLSCLAEVNLGEEASKHGFSPKGLPEALAPLAELEGLDLRGLMAIPPRSRDPQEARAWFARLRELRDELASLPEWSGFDGWLSMGMSGDYELAVEEGATHVRVGTALFGERPPAGAGGGR